MQEKRAAKDYNGRTTPGSGNQWHSKGDVKSDTHLIECKTTTKDSYSLKLETWQKIHHEAILENLDPMMEIEFADRGVTLVVLNKDDYIALLDRHCGEGCTGWDCDFCRRS